MPVTLPTGEKTLRVMFVVRSELQFLLKEDNDKMDAVSLKDPEVQRELLKLFRKYVDDNVPL